MTERERRAFAAGYDLLDILAVSRTVTGPEIDQARYDDLAWDLGLEYQSGRMSAGEYATRIAEAVRECGL